jgi:hypothetical protein
MADIRSSDPAFPKGSKGEEDMPASAPPGQILTGKQEHCELEARHHNHAFPITPVTNIRLLSDLKRELIARQVREEISELNSPTALQRFGAPFRSEFGEVAPVDSELPILRYIFVHHVRNFPFLDQAREKEFWQDKLQIVGVSTLRGIRIDCKEILLTVGYLVFGIIC